jgi:hypothetical protein
MADIEAPRRAQAIARLAPWCECIPLVPVLCRDDNRGEVDVLCRPKEVNLSDFTLALEIKTYPLVGDKQMGKWIKQASDYVGARPDNDWPRISSAFLWLVGMEIDKTERERVSMSGMLQLGQYFRVGSAREFKGCLELVFGPSAMIFTEKRGWTPRAGELLNALRQSGGVRRRL